MISRPPNVEIQRKHEKNYHAFTKSHLPISVSFSTPTVYDSTSNRMTIFGGFGLTNPDFDFGTFNDVWVLANANGSGGNPAWTQLHPKFAGDGLILPGSRVYFSAVRDPGTNSMIIFGGISIEAGYVSPWVLS